MAKQVQKWWQGRNVLLVESILLLLSAYVFGSWAIDTGSLLIYVLTLSAIGMGIWEFIRFIRYKS